MRGGWFYVVAVLLGALLYLAAVGAVSLLTERWERADPTVQWYAPASWPLQEVWL